MAQYSNIFTIPNTLSVSRIVLLPLLYALLALGLRFPFMIAYAVIGATDAFDGIVARRLKQTSELGKTLDSVADLFYYLSSLVFIYFWFPYIVNENVILLVGFFVVFLLSFIVSWVKIGKPILMHTQLLRLNAVLVYFLVVFAFIVEDIYAIYFASIILFIYFVAFTEEIAIFLFYGDVDRDTKFIWNLFGTKNK